MDREGEFFLQTLDYSKLSIAVEKNCSSEKLMTEGQKYVDRTTFCLYSYLIETKTFKTDNKTKKNSTL